MLRRLGLVLVLAALFGAAFVTISGADGDRTPVNQVTSADGIVPPVPIVRQDPSDPPVRLGALLPLALVLAALASAARRPSPIRRRADRSSIGRVLALGGFSSRAPPLRLAV